MNLPRVPQSQLLQLEPAPRRAAHRRFMHPGEQEVLIALVATLAAALTRVVEIGVNEGLTARALLNAFPTIGEYLGVDVLPGYVTSKAVQRREVPERPGHLAAADPRFMLLLRPRGSLDLGPADLGRADVVFIDGDHGRAAVEHDTALARAAVRPGGLIIWHDYHDLGTVDVRVVLDEMHAAGAPIQHVEGTWLAFERVPAARNGNAG